MNNIELKLSVSQLNTLVWMFGHLQPIQISDSREVKVSRCILDKIILRMKKKYLDVSPLQTSSKKVKKMKFSLEYCEAFYLEEFVSLMTRHPLSDYDRNVVLFIQSTLNQKMA